MVKTEGCGQRTPLDSETPSGQVKMTSHPLQRGCGPPPRMIPPSQVSTHQPHPLLECQYNMEPSHWETIRTGSWAETGQSCSTCRTRVSVMKSRSAGVGTRGSEGEAVKHSLCSHHQQHVLQRLWNGLIL